MTNVTNKPNKKGQKQQVNYSRKSQGYDIIQEYMGGKLESNKAQEKVVANLPPAADVPRPILKPNPRQPISGNVSGKVSPTGGQLSASNKTSKKKRDQSPNDLAVPSSKTATTIKVDAVMKPIPIVREDN